MSVSLFIKIILHSTTVTKMIILNDEMRQLQKLTVIYFSLVSIFPGAFANIGKSSLACNTQFSVMHCGI